MTTAPRTATIDRTTGETRIHAVWETDGSGSGDIKTGIAFFDHMLLQIVRHGKFNLILHAEGDLAVDAHHTVEDCGLVIGQALRQSLADFRGIKRFGSAYAPLDESLARTVVDFSGRPGLFYTVNLSRTEIGGIDSDLFREFFRAMTTTAQLTLHIELLHGINAHHQIEAIFKAVGLALAAATTRSGDNEIPSTKGVL